MADHTALRRWLLLFCALFPILAIWALANPMFASPDEPVHMVRAQGFSNLDFSNPYRTDGIPVDAAACFVQLPDVTAECMELDWIAGTVEIDARSTNGYPPLLHLAAAIPAVFVDGLVGAYAMRLWMAAVVAAGFAWAAMLLSRPGIGPWPVTGLILAMTPQVIFISSSVNPSGITAAGAALLIAAVISARLTARITRGVIVAALAGAGAMVLTRREGTLMLAAVLVALAPLMPPQPVDTLRRAISDAGRAHRNRVVAGVGAAVVAVGLVWWRWGEYAAGFLRSPGQRRGTLDLAEAVRTLPRYFSEMLGRFGWMEAPIGVRLETVGTVAIALLLLMAIALGRRRFVLATLWAMAVAAAVVVSAGMVEVDYLQARYVFPLWLAMMMVAGAAVETAELPQRVSMRLSAALLVVWAVLQVGGFFVNQRRYSVGYTDIWEIGAVSRWDPPMMSTTVSIVVFIAVMVVAGWLYSLMRRGSDLFGESS